jgi:hypothetical protein
MSQAETDIGDIRRRLLLGDETYAEIKKQLFHTQIFAFTGNRHDHHTSVRPHTAVAWQRDQQSSRTGADRSGIF